MLKSGTTVEEVHALVTNKILMKYAFWLVVANAVAIIAARQSLRGRNPLYTILASLACVFLAPTLVPLLTGTPITWIQNDQTVITALTVAVVSYLVARHFIRLLPIRIIAMVVLAAASSNIIAAGWKVGLTAFKSTTGAILIASLDAVLRPLSLHIEAYLKDGSLGSTKYIRSHLFAVLVYAAIVLNKGDEKLAHVAVFAIVALGNVASVVVAPINWFFPLELVLLGTSHPAVPAVTHQAIKQEPGTNNNTPASTPSKKGGKH